MRVAVRHATSFRFADRANYSIHDTRLLPVVGEGQRLISWTLRGPGRRHDWADGYGNVVATFSLSGPHNELEFVAEGLYEVRSDAAWLAFSGPDPLPPGYWLLNRGLARHDAAMDQLVEGLLRTAAEPEQRVATLHDLCGRVADRITYRVGASNVGTTALEALAAGAGVRQDQAHVFIAACRRLGVPARYVSGYLRNEPTGSTGSASHGWAEAWVPDLGWIGFDAANRCSPNADYLKLAVGLDYASAAPITGRRVGQGADTEMSVEVSVRRIG
jgi:transglutaminase-like putative cysteine protease